MRHGNSSIWDPCSLHIGNFSITLPPSAVAPRQHLTISKCLLGGSPGNHPHWQPPNILYVLYTYIHMHVHYTNSHNRSTNRQWLVMFDGLCGLEIPDNTKSALGRRLRFIFTYEPTRVMLFPDSFGLLSLRMWSGCRYFSRVCVNLRRYSSSLCKRVHEKISLPFNSSIRKKLSK